MIKTFPSSQWRLRFVQKFAWLFLLKAGPLCSSVARLKCCSGGGGELAEQYNCLSEMPAPSSRHACGGSSRFLKITISWSAKGLGCSFSVANEVRASKKQSCLSKADTSGVPLFLLACTLIISSLTLLFLPFYMLNMEFDFSKLHLLNSFAGWCNKGKGESWFLFSIFKSGGLSLRILHEFFSFLCLLHCCYCFFPKQNITKAFANCLTLTS